MSVINRMLQDLEKRQANSPVNASLSSQVRVAIPRERENIIPWRWLAIVLLTVTCLVLGYLYWRQIQPLPVKQAQQPTVVPVISPPMLKSETSLAMPEAPNNDTSTGVAEVQTPIAASIPLVKGVQPSAPKKSAQLPNPTTPNPAVVAAKGAPSLPQENEPSSVEPPSPPPVSNTPAEVKNIKQITPEQVADNNYQRALEMLQQGRIAEAQAKLESVLKQNPKHMGARQALLGIMVENRQTASAIKLLQTGLALDPARVEYAMALARLQVDANDNGSALGTMQKYLPQGAERADYQGFLALLLERSNRHKEAAQHYQAALRMSPDTAQWWMGLGISLQAAGDMQGAFQAYSQAKQLGTLSPELLTFIDQRMRQVQQQMR